MKKLSIVLALIMALSCFSLTAFAQEETTVEETTVEETTVPEVETTTVAPTTVATTVADPATVIIHIAIANVDGTSESYDFRYSVKGGTTLTAADILAAAKGRLDADGNAILDTEEYVVSDVVVAYDDQGGNGVKGDQDNEQYAFNKEVVAAGETYEYLVCATEIDDVKNLVVTIFEQTAKLDWGGIAKANVALWNQIINGTKAAVESLVNADWPECTEAPTEAPTEVETPETGVSAVAGAAVVVLALSATTAVVLRKKED